MGGEGIRLAIIGCGGMAGAHLRAYEHIRKKEPEKFVFAAMCDPILISAQKFADKAEAIQGFKPRVYGSVGEMLEHEELDAADVCTPHSEHHIVAIPCLNAGVNVMVEKPFGVTVKASKAMIEAGKRNNRIVAVAENIRRGLSQRTANWIFNEAKLLGSPRLFYAQHASWEDPAKERRWHWRVSKMMGGGGMVMDSGAHFCDTIRYLFGDVDTVYAKVEQLDRRPHKKDDVMVNDEREDTWVATLTFKSGLIGVWSWTISAPGYSFTNIVYYGSKGCLVDYGDVFHGPSSNAELLLMDGSKRPMSELQKEYLASLSGEEREALFPYGFTDGVVLECYDFLEAIEKGRRPEIDGEDGLKAKAVCEAIFESAYCGQPVRYEDVLNGKVEEYQRPINEYWKL